MSTGFAIVYLVLAAVAVGGAWKMIFSHHPVHSALYFVLNLCSVALLYLMLGAPFIAVAQVTVYAGAIMVLFLFIIMYLNLGLSRDVLDAQARRWTAYGTALLLVLLLLAGGVMSWSGAVAGLSSADLQAGEQAVAAGQASVPGKPAGTPQAGEVLQAARAATDTKMSTVEDIGITLFGRYTFPFEVASLLILVAMIGVLVIARPQLLRETQTAEEARS